MKPGDYAYIIYPAYKACMPGDIVVIDTTQRPHGTRAIHLKNGLTYFYRWEWLELAKDLTRLEKAFNNIKD